MNKFHPVLINQLRRLGVTLDKDISPDELRTLLNLVSETYNESDEYRYAMERSLDIASEELAFVGKINNEKLEKFSTLISQGVIYTDKDWMITEANAVIEKMINKGLLNDRAAIVEDKIIFLNIKKIKIDFNKLSEYFDCGQRYYAKKCILLVNEENPKFYTVDLVIVPIYKEGEICEFALLIDDITESYTLELKEKVNQLTSDAFAKFLDLNLKINLKELAELSIDNEIYLSLLENSSDKELIQFYRQSMYTNFGKTNLLLDPVFEQVPANLKHNECVRVSELIHILELSFQKTIEYNATVFTCNLNGFIRGSIHQFETIFKDLLLRITQEFLAFPLTKIEFVAAKNDLNDDQHLVIKMHMDLKTQALIKSDREIHKRINAIQAEVKHLAYEIQVESLSLSVKLADFIYLPQLLNQDTETAELRILVYTKDKSLLYNIIRENQAINRVKFQIVSDREEFISLFKRGRLEQQEYHLIFSDSAELLALESSLLYEIRSFLGSKFMGFYLFSNHQLEIEDDSEKLKLQNMLYADFIKNYTIFINQLYIKLIGKHYVNKLDQFLTTNLNREVLFLNVGSKINYSYIELMTYLGLVPICVNQLEESQLDYYCSLQALIVDIQYDFYGFSEGQLNLVKRILNKRPSLILFHDKNHKALQFVENQKISSYLIKPFSLQQLMQGLGDLFQ